MTTMIWLAEKRNILLSTRSRLRDLGKIGIPKLGWSHPNHGTVRDMLKSMMLGRHEEVTQRQA
jgi:hypothetical protein